MTMPLFQSVFPATEFDVFLDEIGLADLLSPEEKEQLVYKSREIVKYNITGIIIERMDTEAKQEELARLMEESDKTGDSIALHEFFLREIPDWEALVDEAVQSVKRDLRDGVANLPSMIEKVKNIVKLNEPEQPTEPPTPAAKEEAEDLEPFPWEQNPSVDSPAASPVTPTESVSDEADDHTTQQHTSTNTTDSEQAIHDELDVINNNFDDKK